MASVQAEDKAYDEINITPMLDLAYVLLVIFVIMTTATVQGMKVDLPRATPARSLAARSTKAVTITRDGKVFMDTIPMQSLEELGLRLEQQKGLTPDFPVVLRADGGVRYRAVMDVLDLLARHSITAVGIATKPRVGG